MTVQIHFGPSPNWFISRPFGSPLAIAEKYRVQFRIIYDAEARCLVRTVNLLVVRADSEPHTCVTATWVSAPTMSHQLAQGNRIMIHTSPAIAQNHQTTNAILWEMPYGY